jgi:hypothetical protein
MPLKPYHELPCDPDLQQVIADRVLNFLLTKTDLFDHLEQVSLWNKLDTTALIREVPELVKYFRDLGLRLRELAVTVCNSNKNAYLHIDELPVTAKINFPILNTAGSRNLWYQVPAELMTKPRINEFGAEFYDLSTVDLDQCQLIGSIEMLKPVVFNSQIPHMIDMSESRVFPRLVLTCMFFNEPVDFLKE